MAYKEVKKEEKEKEVRRERVEILGRGRKIGVYIMFYLNIKFLRNYIYIYVCIYKIGEEAVGNNVFRG